MHLWALSSVLMAVAAIAFAARILDEDVNSGSLRSALEAVSRRQRDLNSGKQFFGLGSYRDNSDDLSFLSQDNDPQIDDGQPENIGYGFQKSLAHHTLGDPLTMKDEIEDQERKMFEQLAVEYLKDEFQKIDDANDQYYQSGEEKRSAFRERELPERHSGAPGKMGNSIRKRGSFGAFAPTSFRERNYKGETEDEKRRRIMKSINRRMGQEFEEPLTEDGDEYSKLIQSLWERYRETDPNLEDIEQLSESDVENLLNYLEDNGSGRKIMNEGPTMKRMNGAGAEGRQAAAYDYNDFVIRKRGKQMLDEGEAPSNTFLYSLKYVSPEFNREAVEQMRDNEGIDTSGENDDDVLRLGLKSIEDPDHRESEEWHALPRNVQDIGEYAQESPVNFLPHSDHSRKRFKINYHQNRDYRNTMKRKRFPVAKRSSDFRDYDRETLEDGRIRMKKSTHGDSHTTDPKVASELSHIFEPSSNENTIKITPQIIGNHVVTKQKMVIPTSPPPKINISNVEVTAVVVNVDKNSTTVEPSHLNEEMEIPVTMSRSEAPIEIKKKSIDWTDYFGLDRRRKKTGLDTHSGNGIVGDDSWLLNQYYRSMSAAVNKRPASHRNKKDVHLAVQPFDTRLYDENNLMTHQPIFKSKKDHDVSEVDEARIDKMDTKLRNIEDVILNEAVKYTGAHEGTTDSKEVQEVKDRVISRLAAAYNLEKMRQALAEFKSSLMAQKNSKFNPENQEKPLDSEEKRGGQSKLKLGDDKNLSNGKNPKNGYPDDTSDLNGPLTENMSEGYMGGLKSLQNEHYGNECSILGNVLKKCRNVEMGVGFGDYEFLSLCTLHQICYVCGPEIGSDSMSACDGMFFDKAEAMCNGDVFCEKAALRWIMALKHHQPSDDVRVTTTCWENFCASQPVVDLAQASQS